MSTRVCLFFPPTPPSHLSLPCRHQCSLMIYSLTTVPSALTPTHIYQTPDLITPPSAPSTIWFCWPVKVSNFYRKRGSPDFHVSNALKVQQKNVTCIFFTVPYSGSITLIINILWYLGSEKLISVASCWRSCRASWKGRKLPVSFYCVGFKEVIN